VRDQPQSYAIPLQSCQIASSGFQTRAKFKDINFIMVLTMGLKLSTFLTTTLVIWVGFQVKTFGTTESKFPSRSYPS